MAAPGRRVEPLSEIEQKILEFMVQYLRANTYQPSIREIGERFGIKSTKTVSEHLQALAEKGFLERDPARSRGVRILGVDLSADTVAVPCFDDMPVRGRSADSDAVLSFDRRLVGHVGSFLVRASAGDLGVLGVNEGDMLLVAPATAAEVEDGAVVVIDLGSGSLFHRLVRNGSGTFLEALQPGAERTAVEDEASLKLIGRVTGMYRRMDDSAAVNLTQH